MNLKKLNLINAAEFLNCFTEDCISKIRAQPRDIDCKDIKRFQTGDENEK